jgi:hypothetical protein
VKFATKGLDMSSPMCIAEQSDRRLLNKTLIINSIRDWVYRWRILQYVEVSIDTCKFLLVDCLTSRESRS